MIANGVRPSRAQQRPTAMGQGDIDAILQTMDDLERALADAQARLARLEQFFPCDRAAVLDDAPAKARMIQNAVAAHAELSTQQMLSESRRTDIVWPRMVAMWLTRQLLPSMTLLAIAALFNRTDYHTVLHACKSVESEMQTNRKADAQVRNLLAHIQHLFQQRTTDHGPLTN